MNRNLNPDEFSEERRDIRFVQDDSRRGSVATDAEGNVIGLLEVTPGKPAVGALWVDPSHRRRGVATELFKRTQAEVPDLEHNEYRSPAGEKWSRSVAGDASLPPRKRMTNKQGEMDAQRLIGVYQGLLRGRG